MQNSIKARNIYYQWNPDHEIGLIVCHINGDSEDFDIYNLIGLSQKQHRKVCKYFKSKWPEKAQLTNWLATGRLPKKEFPSIKRSKEIQERISKTFEPRVVVRKAVS